MTSNSRTEQCPPAGRSVDEGGTDVPLHRLVVLAARALRFSDATISILDGTGRRVLASTSVCGGARDDVVATLDAAVGRSGRPVFIEDVADGSSDPALRSNGAVEGSYLGVPLVNTDDSVIGVLCVTDPTRRSIEAEEIGLLSDVGRVVSDHLDLVRRAIGLGDGSAGGADDVGRAVANGEIVPWYQPIVDLTTGQVIGVEALARWEHTSGDVEGPDAFIAIAERTSLIVQLDLAVLRRALVDLRRWQEMNPGLRLSVNFSGRHLDRDDWVGQVRGAVEDAGVSPSTIDLELTETARPSDYEAGGAMMQELRGLGFKIWFDDFGVGWSSLQDLIHLPVDGIKLDKSFADDLGHRVGDIVIRTLTSAATELGLKVTIEGIENKEQAGLARSLGCDHAQGFLWSPAVAADLVDQLVAMPSRGLPSQEPV